MTARLARLIAVSAFCVFVSACSSATAPTPEIVYVTAPPATPAATPAGTTMHALMLTLSLHRSGNEATWSYVTGLSGPCQGIRDFADIAPGTTVTVTDQAGTIIGSGNLAFDAVTNDGACELADTLALPDATFYSIAIAKRSATTIAASDLAAQGWHVDLSLGG
ncbi:MAG TPA: hypothetical protein VMH41_16970 [Mycobacteriales bacterium]|nr:hypothetical protein [Mycobacteriales bacterium]